MQSLIWLNSISPTRAKMSLLSWDRTNAVPESSVNKIIWAQAGRVTEPGRYLFKFGWLTVTAEDLGVWKQYPNAAFTLLRTAPAEEAEDEFRLGAFELRENMSLSEK